MDFLLCLKIWRQPEIDLEAENGTLWKLTDASAVVNRASGVILVKAQRRRVDSTGTISHRMLIGVCTVKGTLWRS